MSTQQGQIVPIFPTPIMALKLGRKFTLDEMNCILNYQKDVLTNPGNVTTKNLHVLENEALADLKLKCQIALDNYLEYIFSPVNLNTISLDLTHSWLNYTNPGGYHHAHTHPNSIVSGVLYISAQKQAEHIVFSRDLNLNIQVQTNKPNPFNSVEMYFPVETGDIVLFPSNLVHTVPESKGNSTRISLAFNSYFSGDLGYVEGPLKGFNSIALQSQAR